MDNGQWTMDSSLMELNEQKLASIARIIPIECHGDSSLMFPWISSNFDPPLKSSKVIPKTHLGMECASQIQTRISFIPMSKLSISDLFHS